MTKPGNFLFTTWEGGGNIAPAITVARGLRARGHRVRFVSDEANRLEAERAGLEFRCWRRAPNRQDRTPASCPVRDWEAGSPQEGIERLLDQVILGSALAYAQDVVEILDEEAADLVVTSEMLLGVLAGCERCGQRVAILAANLCIYPVEGMPSFGPGLPPPRTEEERRLHGQIRESTTAMLNVRLEALNRARLELGLPPVDCVMKQLEVAERHFLATTRAFDFPVAELPAEIRYVGPQLGEPGWAEHWRSPWGSGDDRPLVLVGFSTTYQAQEGVLQKVMDAAADLPVRVLVTLGPISHGLLRPASNAVLVTSAPHNAVMQECAIVVTHGGHGTVMRALSHHRPLLVIPQGRDQDENAVRVVEHGAGLRLSTQSSVEDIRGALRRLLHEPAFSAAARRLGLAIAEESGRIQVAGELEALAFSDAPRPV